MQLPEFDVLLEMARTDPDGLEALRYELVEHVIQQAPSEQQPRLRGVQFRVDLARQASSNPLSACMRISQLMHESLGRLHASLTGTRHEAPIRSGRVATVVRLDDYRQACSSNKES